MSLLTGEDWTRSSSGLWLPPSEKRPTCFDLFCGAGGFSVGMQLAGFDVIGACDNDALAAVTYLTNLGAYPCQMYWLDDTAEARMEKAVQRELGKFRAGKINVMPTCGAARQNGSPGDCRHFFFGDIRRLRGEDVLHAFGMEAGELDCIVGGPPCQGFSTSGKRNVMDPRNSLVFEFTRLVCEIQPKTMIFENVPGIASMVTTDGLPVMEAICLSLSKGGFGTLDALRRSLAADGTRRAAVRSSSNTGKVNTASRPKMPATDAEAPSERQLELLMVRR